MSAYDPKNYYPLPKTFSGNISIEDIIDIVSYYVEIKKGKRHT